MNILMLTNTFTPHVGGVARSVATFSHQLRQDGHRVVVVAPTFADCPEHESDVVRLPAIHRFHHSDFSLPFHFPGSIGKNLRGFHPEVVHSHHPFLLGDTALRFAALHDIPILFSHHTLYERYCHYLPGGNSPFLQRFVINLVTGYCNLCTAVIAPSLSLLEMLRARDVRTPIEVVPTGIDTELFSPGSGSGLRRRLGLGPDAFLIGHVGRLAQEKNLRFLARAVARYLAAEPRAHFLLSGQGPEAPAIDEIFHAAGLQSRFHLLAPLPAPELVEAYRAMDLFAFTSQTETQGIVLLEAMATGTPVVALDGPGVREVLEDRRNGRLVKETDAEAFARALAWVAAGDAAALAQQARTTATAFSIAATTATLTGLYLRVREDFRRGARTTANQRSQTCRLFKEEGRILANLWHAAENSFPHEQTDGREEGR